MAEKRGTQTIGFLEFVVLAAATMSTQAIAIDAMLPAFPTIVRALQVGDPNHGQWIVTAYMTGLGLGLPAPAGNSAPRIPYDADAQARAAGGQARTRHARVDFLHARHDGDIRNHHGLRWHGGADFLRGLSPAQVDAQHVRAVRHFHGHGSVFEFTHRGALRDAAALASGVAFYLFRLRVARSNRCLWT